MDKNVMRIMAYWGPHPHHWMQEELKGQEDPYAETISDEYFKVIADCGINVITHCHTDFERYPEELFQSLELASKYNIGYLVKDEVLVEEAKAADADLDKLAERVKKYSKYPAYRGVFMIDEPKTKEYPIGVQPYMTEFPNAVANFKKMDIPYMCGLLPLYGEYDWDGWQQIYKDYVKEYCEVMKTKELHCDHYPFVSDREPRLDIYFWNLDVVREYADKYGMVFINTIQAGGQWNDHRAHFDSVPYYPTEGQFTWNVNTCLAMGAKAIAYFPLIQPYHFAWAESTEYDFSRNGLIGGDGRKNQWYYYAQKVNKQIAAIDEVLLNTTFQGVIAKGEKAKKDLSPTNCVIASENFEELISVKGDTLIGCFKYEGKTALYVVNYDMEKAGQITLSFDGKQHLEVIQNAKETYVDTDSITLEMEAGEGILIVVE